MWESFTAAVQREVRTTVGRRARSLSGARSPPKTIARPPAGATGLVLQDDDDDGFAVVERKKSSTQPQAARAHEEEPPLVVGASYIVGGEEDAPHEDGSLPFAGSCLRLLFSLCATAGQVARHGLAGLFQAHHPLLTLHNLRREPAWRGSVVKCLAVDVVLFRGALLCYERALPRLCRSLLGVRLGLGYDYAVMICWAVPAYILCETVTTVIHVKMAKGLSALAPAVGGAAARPAAGGDSGRLMEVATSVAGADARGSATSAPPARDPAGGGDAMIGIAGIVYTRLIYILFCIQLKLLCSLPLVGPLLSLVLSSLLHAYDCFEFVWDHRGIGVGDRFALIEDHWLYFMGYGGILAACSLHLRFFDLFALRAVLYPLYIANAPHARFAACPCRPLPVFRAPLAFFNAILQLAAMRLETRTR